MEEVLGARDGVAKEDVRRITKERKKERLKGVYIRAKRR